MLTIEELMSIVSAICDAGSAKETRTAAEARLLQLQSEPGAWQSHLQLLITVVDGNLLFFLCIGLQRILWKNWSSLTTSEKQMIIAGVAQALREKHESLPPFARNKAEQVLAVICQCSFSLDPVLQLVVPVDQPGASTGVSCLKTVFEEILGTNKKISPDKRLIMVQAATAVASAATQLAANVIQLSAQANTGDTAILISAVELMKIVMGKLPIGAHISPDILNLLFNLAELVITSPSFGQSSVKAVEALTEFTTQKCIPLGPSGVDIGGMLLVELAAKAIGLLQRIITAGSIQDNDCVPAILEFITSFIDGHLERCIKAPSTGLIGNITTFMRELVSLSCASTSPDYLTKIAAMWEKLLTIEYIKEHVLLIDPLPRDACVPLARHILLSCCSSVSAPIKEIVEDMEEGLVIEPLSDTHMQSLVGHLADGGGGLKESGTEGRVSGAEEQTCVGLMLRQSSAVCLAELSVCPDVHALLEELTPQLLQQAVAVVSTGTSSREDASAAAMDLHFVLGLMELTVPPARVAVEISGLMAQLVEARMHSRGKAFLAVEVVMARLVGCTMNRLSQSEEGLTAIVQSLEPIMKATLAACNTMISPAPSSVMIAVSALLLQALQAISIHLDNPSIAGVKGTLVDAIMGTIVPRLGSLPVEVHALLLCCADVLIPECASAQVAQLHGVAVEVCGAAPSVDTLSNPTQVSGIGRLCNAIDAMARHHRMSAPRRRHQFSTAAAPLQECLGPLLNTSLQALGIVAATAAADPSAAPAGALGLRASTLISSCRSILSLVIGLVDSLGKNAFGATALQAFEAIAVGVSGPAGDLLMESMAGVVLVRLMLQLAKTVALSSSAMAATAPQQIAMTHALMTYVCGHLARSHICTELLQDALSVGAVSISCYWKRGAVPGSALVGADATGVAQGGEDVVPIAQLLTQLFDGSMAPNVPPQDAMTALEGMLDLGESHRMFSMAWFQNSELWNQLMRVCVRAMLLNAHPAHEDSLHSLFNLMTRSDLRLAAIPALTEGLWPTVGRETMTLATEFGCTGEANRYLTAAATHFPGFVGLDADGFIVHVVTPLSADVARLQD